MPAIAGIFVAKNYKNCYIYLMKNIKLSKRLKQIRLVLSDVDGVLTDGHIYLDSRGNEMKVFSCKDAPAIKMAKSAGLDVALITGRKSTAAIARAKEHQVIIFFKNDLIKNKKSILEFLHGKYGVNKDEILYVGDDVGDLGLMKNVGVSATPVDGMAENKKIADIITDARGGRGVVAELIYKVLSARNEWHVHVGIYRDKYFPWKAP